MADAVTNFNTILKRSQLSQVPRKGKEEKAWLTILHFRIRVEKQS